MIVVGRNGRGRCGFVVLRRRAAVVGTLGIGVLSGFIINCVQKKVKENGFISFIEFNAAEKL